MTINRSILLVVLILMAGSAHSTEWIDCNGENIWVGVLVSFDDHHIIEFQISEGERLFMDFSIPLTKADTVSHKVQLTAKSTSYGEVLFTADGENGRIEIGDEAYSLQCDWSAFE